MNSSLRRPAGRFALFAVCLVLAGAPLGGVRAAEFVLAKSGQAAAPVVLLPDSGPMAEQAVADLIASLDKMTGGSFATGLDPRVTPVVVAGLASEWAKLTGDDGPAQRLKDASPESFVLQSTPERLLILGRDPNGVSHGVYTLLDSLGCRWYFLTRDWEVIPRKKDVAVDLDRVEGPAMRVRVLSNGAGAGASARLFEDWCRRNRLGSAYGPRSVHHSYEAYVPSELFKERPELFAWVSKDGDSKGTEQNGKQPCTTHPEVVKMFIDGALAKLREEKNRTGRDPQIISISPNDGTTNMCRCERCLETGTYGDCALLLANQVAEAVNKEFPDTMIGLLAYGRAGDIPAKVQKAHPNVLVSIATNFNYRNSVARLIDKWSKISSHPIIYEYYAIDAWGDAAPDNNAPNVEHIARTLRSWHRQGVEGINGEMNNNWGSVGHRLWAFSRLAWNPDQPVGEVNEDFFEGCWGEAAAPMRRYFGRWEAGHPATPRTLRSAWGDLEEAAALAKTPEVTRRVDQMSIYLYWFMLNEEFKKEQDEARRNEIALEGDLLQYRWRNDFMAQIIGAIFSVDRPARIGFTAEEVADIRRKARELLGPGEDVAVAGLFSGDLVPSADAASAGGPADGFLSEASFVFRAQAGENVAVVFTPRVEQKRADAEGGEAATAPAVEDDIDRDPLPMEDGARGSEFGRFQVWWLGPHGDELDFVEEFNPARTGGRPLALNFEARREGLYLINARMKDGAAAADFKGRPHVMAAFPGPARKGLQKLQKVGHVPRSEDAEDREATVYYFYVPKGTGAFALTGRGANPERPLGVSFVTAQGDHVGDYEIEPKGECLVQVPAGRDGAIWKVSLASDRGTVGLAGVPPWVATAPGNLLIPREAAGAASP